MKRDIELRIMLSTDEAIELKTFLDVIGLENSGPDTSPEFISMAKRISGRLHRKLSWLFGESK